MVIFIKLLYLASRNKHIFVLVSDVDQLMATNFGMLELTDIGCSTGVSVFLVRARFFMNDFPTSFWRLPFRKTY
jgi:hypothetical protein